MGYRSTAYIELINESGHSFLSSIGSKRTVGTLFVPLLCGIPHVQLRGQNKEGYAHPKKRKGLELPANECEDPRN